MQTIAKAGCGVAVGESTADIMWIEMESRKAK
jgi:hypothetical protein